MRSVLRLANLREAIVPRKMAAVPVLQALAEATGETAHISMIEGEKLGMLAFAYAAAHATRVTMADAGHMVPATHGAEIAGIVREFLGRRLPGLPQGWSA